MSIYFSEERIPRLRKLNIRQNVAVPELSEATLRLEQGWPDVENGELLNSAATKFAKEEYGPIFDLPRVRSREYCVPRGECE